MVGSPAVAALIAHAAFWMLLAYGCVWGEIKGRGLAAFLALWIGGLYGLPYLSSGAALFSSYVAVVDIALVFVIFKGDVPLT
jgi:hypothetical protein